MQPQVNLPETPIDYLIECIFSTRRMTRLDQERLMSILLSKSLLSDVERNHINRIFDGLRTGRIRVVD